MGKYRKQIFIGMGIVGFILIYIINFTDAFSLKYEYVRLKNGREFHNVPVRWPSDIDVCIDGTYYTKFDIDSLAR